MPTGNVQIEKSCCQWWRDAGQRPDGLCRFLDTMPARRRPFLAVNADDADIVQINAGIAQIKTARRAWPFRN
jgi:hypothetical protein